MKVLVTGGAGFIGSFVVEALLAGGHEVVVVDSLVKGRREHLPGGTRLHQVDITTPDLLPVLLCERPQAVVHLAAQVSVNQSMRYPLQDAGTNLLGSLNLLEACGLAGCRKLVYTSSAAAYGDPLYLPVDEDHPVQPCSPYGISKHSVEHYLPVYRATHGLEYTVLRLANVYGPRQEVSGESGVTTIFVDRCLHRQPLVMHGDGEQTRDFVYVEDVARAAVLALERAENTIFNIGTGLERSLNNLILELQQASGYQPKLQYAPPRPGDIRRSVLKCDRARRRLGWTPKYSLHEGLLRTLNWARQHPFG